MSLPPAVAPPPLPQQPSSLAPPPPTSSLYRPMPVPKGGNKYGDEGFE
jgi:hypothetical protein